MTESLEPSALATTDDVQVSLLRELTEAETTVTPKLLEWAQNRLQARIKDLRTRAEADTAFRANVVTVEAEMVARVLRNPEGMVSEADGVVSYRIDLDVATGRLRVLDEDWELLGVGGAFGTSAGVLDGYARARFGSIPPDQQFQYGWPGCGGMSQELML